MAKDVELLAEGNSYQGVFKYSGGHPGSHQHRWIRVSPEGAETTISQTVCTAVLLHVCASDGVGRCMADVAEKSQVLNMPWNWSAQGNMVPCRVDKSYKWPFARFSNSGSVKESLPHGSNVRMLSANSCQANMMYPLQHCWSIFNSQRITFVL